MVLWIATANLFNPAERHDEAGRRGLALNAGSPGPMRWAYWAVKERDPVRGGCAAGPSPRFVERAHGAWRFTDELRLYDVASRAR